MVRGIVDDIEDDRSTSEIVLQQESAVVVLSGGLDSTTLVYDILDREYSLSCISFNYGQKHRKELDCARTTCRRLGLEHRVVDIPFLGDLPSALTSAVIPVPDGVYGETIMKQTVVLNRNMVLLSLAASYAMSIGATNLFYGAHSRNRVIYPDCRPGFVTAMAEALRQADWSPMVLHAPYIALDKAAIVRLGSRLKVDFSNTWTCYKGDELACGTCPSCIERVEAFARNGLRDPLSYRK